MSVAETEPTTPLKAAALAYARRGWHVFPLHHNVPGGCSCGDSSCDNIGKHPRTKNGLDSASVDPDDVDYFWDQYPDANIGIVAGVSGLAIVDLDSDDAIKRWKNLHPDLPQTYTVKTGKGYHLYFADPTGTERQHVGTGPGLGIDLRAGRSYVVAPPSTHYSGAQYTLVRDVAIAPLPLVVQAYFAAQRKDRKETAQDGAVIGEGARNGYLASIAGTMRGVGMTQNELEAALLQINKDRLDPPLDEREVRSVAKSVSRYPPGAPELLGIVTFGTIGEQTSEQANSWEPIDLLDRQANPPAPPSIAGSVYAGKRHVLSGEPEVGKSWLAMAWCIEVLQRGDHVVYIDHEMGADMALERLRILGASDDEIRRFLYLDPIEPIEQGINIVEPLIERRTPALTIIDSTIGSLVLHGYDPNIGKDIEAWYQRVVNRFLRHGGAVVVLDHVAKNPETRGMYSIGSERKIGISDVHLSVEKISAFSRNKGGKSKVVVKKDRPGHLSKPTHGTFELDSTLPGIKAYRWLPYTGEQTQDEEGHFRPTVLMQRVSDYLATSAPASKKRIEQDVTGKTAFIRQALEALIREGYVGTSEGVRNHGHSTEHTLLKPYSEANDPYPSTPSSPPRPTPRPENVKVPLVPLVPSLQGDEEEGRGGTASKNNDPSSLNEPCPSCSTKTGSSPWPTAGGTYCCHDCARGEACACKYLETGT